jgi:hypothetical protein
MEPVECGKLLQYMALEIPSVATPAGVNAKSSVRVKKFTAQTEEEWTKKISTNSKILSYAQKWVNR